jgi:hypothetical protein
MMLSSSVFPAVYRAATFGIEAAEERTDGPSTLAP